MRATFDDVSVCEKLDAQMARAGAGEPQMDLETGGLLQGGRRTKLGSREDDAVETGKAECGGGVIRYPFG